MILIIVKLKHKQERKTAMDNNLVRNASVVWGQLERKHAKALVRISFILIKSCIMKKEEIDNTTDLQIFMASLKNLNASLTLILFCIVLFYCIIAHLFFLTSFTHNLQVLFNRSSISHFTNNKINNDLLIAILFFIISNIPHTVSFP